MNVANGYRNIDMVRSSLDAMPRARHMGLAALELCNDGDRKVMSGQNFIILMRQAVDSIEKWAGAVELSDEVRAFRDATDDELLELQKKHRFSKVQLMQWTGEMKIQLFDARRLSS